MPEASQASAEAVRQDVPRSNGLSSLPYRTYRLRALGMGLAFLPGAAVLHENGGSWLAWVWIFIGGLVWPHVAYQIAPSCGGTPGKGDAPEFARNQLLGDRALPCITPPGHAVETRVAHQQRIQGYQPGCDYHKATNTLRPT